MCVLLKQKKGVTIMCRLLLERRACMSISSIQHCVSLSVALLSSSFSYSYWRFAHFFA